KIVNATLGVTILTVHKWRQDDRMPENRGWKPLLRRVSGLALVVRLMIAAGSRSYDASAASPWWYV
ncbi:MAG: hypothetical protein KJO46_07625, partial [Gammaproteobacteria bacterium]|nr:hypothetical protein [Gammaproteobacteria bacterium]